LILINLGSGLAGIGAALRIDSPVGFGMALAALGFFSGIYHPAGLGLISKEMQRVSVGMGFNGMFGNLGLATAPLLTGFVNWLWGPPAAYLFFLSSGDATDRKHFGGQFYTQKVSSFSLWHQICFDFRGGGPGC
jgi:MFS family permease